MALIPFIEDYLNNIHDTKATSELLKLNQDCIEKLNNIDKQEKNYIQLSPLPRDIVSKSKKIDFEALRKQAIVEAIKKADQIAGPHVEDKKKLDEIRIKNGLKKDIQLESKKTDQHLAEKQERMKELKVEHKSKEAEKHLDDKQEKMLETIDEKKEREVQELLKKLGHAKQVEKKEAATTEKEEEKKELSLEEIKEKEVQELLEKLGHKKQEITEKTTDNEEQKEEKELSDHEQKEKEVRELLKKMQQQNKEDILGL